MYPPHCFGKDYPDRIVMSIFSSSGRTFNQTVKQYNRMENNYSTIYKVINDRKDDRFIFTFFKNNDYNFENMLLVDYYGKLISLTIGLNFPVYILKDNKWFEVSPPNFVFIPCGE